MDYIHEIIKRYLKNRYPQNLETKIQQWLCEDKFSEEKNEALFRCWSEIKSDSDSYCSQSSWENISIRLGFRTSAVSWKKYGYIVASLLLCTFMTTVWLLHNYDTTKTLVVKTGKGEYKTIILSDSSTICLGPSSEITCAENFIDTVRLVRLKGDAWFEVSHMLDKPFIVKSTNLTTKVIGTKFNVRDYKKDTCAIAYLLTGSIEILTPENTSVYILKPNEFFSYNKLTHQTHISTQERVSLLFKNATLGDIKNTLEQRFKISIKLSGYSDERYTLDFEATASIQEVMETLCLLDDNLSWEKKNAGQIIIYVKSESR
ncbi:FecR family protein [Phocaeicola vulgatus]|jgi:transmembrane sensor|uniref:FecR family protein n=1 Tax=Phocaeicola vulgatus TaxID=821 RepID=A0A3E4X289_PHOVU|nr:FecR family protein [Phocaeicola vulgatus]MCG0227747.1 FecR family protein [Phocaeicola vulgatus]RGM48582.1 FecR family protein [Phocaeicola vulgatus]TSE50469.1 fecR protein [Phocaeicola vulgatus]TSE54553.1 fecR protein [Phocaeicola vulgatus]